ncbi:TBC1 domain family member 2A isoform X2 [Hippocampus zosterae]|uniref:TBC1 domain family member 2A isoform X2 n=1 Tax=Hippocampus zosterae TaxID=109293 RepID=UPI00223E5C47|nr:TBC1 domain family member 2A isoform X2 [Hippocampus zosterae]
MDPLQTSTLAHLDPHQTPAHLGPQLPAQLDSHPSPLPVRQDARPAPLLAQLDPPQTPTPTKPDPHPTSTSACLDPHQTRIPAAHLDFLKAHVITGPCETPSAHPSLHTTPLKTHLDRQLSAHQNRRQAPPPAHLDPHQATLTAGPVCHQTTAPVRLDPNQILTHADPDSHQPLPPAHPDSHQAPLIAHLDPHPTPTPAHCEPLRCPPPVHPEPHQTPPPAHLEPHQVPPPANLDTHQPPLTAQLALHQITPPAHPNPNQTVTLARLDLHQAAPPAHLDPHQAPSTAHLDPCLTSTPTQRYPIQSPAPSHLVPRQTPPPAHLDTRQAPPPAHLDSYRTPLPVHSDPQDAPNFAGRSGELYPIQSPAPSHLVPRHTPPPAQPHPYQTPLPVHWDSQDTPNFPGRSGEPKLCGYLLKQGGPLRAWKRRWFVYEEKQNQMFYYRTPQDVTPLGRVDLGSATFTYPLKAEMGTFHIETPERTYTLKAVTQDLMLYWLQQLQLNRWHHRRSHQTSACPDAMGNITENFLPLLRSPVGLVGQEAANEAPRGTPLADVSIKHPFIQIQNAVHSLRKRSSQEWAQSVFSAQGPAGVRQAEATADDTASAVTPPAGALLDAARGKKNRSSSGSPAAMSSEAASRLQRDKEMLTEEVKAQKELVWLLHKTLEAAQREKRTCADFVAAESERERLELLRHRERQAADLLGRAERAEAVAEEAKRDLDRSDRRMAQLRDEVRMLTEKNQAKREVIIKLSDHVAACVSEPARSTSSARAPDSLRQLQQCVEDLKDDIEAYKTQNRFLNSEIFQLTKLWRKSSEQERSLMVKCAYLEAWRCQAESRYLGVLSKLQENASLDPEQRRWIQQMVEEAVQGQAKNDTAAANGLHDEYGFRIVPEYEVEDVKLLAKIQALEIRSHNLLRQGGQECDLSSRWAQYLAGRSDDDFCPSPELKALLRAGVPPEYRRRVWRCLVRIRTGAARERQPQRYRQLCDKSRACAHPASRQIRLDLHRTLSSNRNFSSPWSLAHQQLERILLAFSWHNPSVGYCQGLNRLAAIALVVLQSEEEAFWCLVAVVDAIMPEDYYRGNLLAAQVRKRRALESGRRRPLDPSIGVARPQVDQHVLKDFLPEKLPRLAAHFHLHGIDVSVVTFGWFLVVFVESLPSDLLLPLWDAFLYEGTKVMFRYALALFKYKEDDILKIHDGVDIYQYLGFFTKTVTDGRKLTGMAFVDMNPFPGRLLKNRRLLHLERLRGELRELEEQQEAFAALGADASWRRSLRRRPDDQTDNAASEDDEEMG